MTTLHLTEHDPEPVTVIDNDSMLIFAGPHNGHAVPSCLPQCLGTEPTWFDKAHEAVDLNMDKLFAALQNADTDASYIYGNYSRLVCDLNATPDHAITQRSSEFDDFKIPNNQPDQCCEQQYEDRLNTFYHPYHDAKKSLVDKTRAQHGGVILLDLHSFAPTWHQTQREVEIGTLRHEKTHLSYALEDYLKSQSAFNFVSGEPYRVAERPHNAAAMIAENNDLQYLGLEIRNDLIDTPEGVERMTAFIRGCVDYLMSHPDIDNIAAPLSHTTSAHNAHIYAAEDDTDMDSISPA